MFSNDTKNWLVILKNRNKNWKILTNFWKFSDIFSFFSYLSAQKGNSVFSRSSANFGEDSRSRGVIKSIPRGIEEWKKFRDLEDRGTRNSSCHPYMGANNSFEVKNIEIWVSAFFKHNDSSVATVLPPTEARLNAEKRVSEGRSEWKWARCGTWKLLNIC